MVRRTIRNRSRRNRNKTAGGGSCGNGAGASAAAMPAMPPANAAPKVGGRRKTRKLSKGASSWNKLVMKVYHDMKKKDPNVKLGAAMKRAAQMKKSGQA